VEFAIEVAVQAEVKQLILFHHDPMHSDAIIDDMIEDARKKAARRAPKLQVHAGQEGFEISL